MKKISSNDRLRNNVKYYRILNKLTQADCAAILEVDEKHFNRLEKGKYNISLKNLDILANYFNKEPWQLLKENHTQDEIDNLK